MPIYYDLETDIRFLQGKEKGAQEAGPKAMLAGLKEGRQEGRDEAMREATKGLLTLGGLNIYQIAAALKVTTDFVLKVQAEMPGSTNA